MRMCAEATYPSQPITQAKCMCACVQKQPTHYSHHTRQSACVHVCMSACMHVCRSNLPITAHHTGRVQEHMKAECKNTRRQSARTHGGRVQEHMEAECKNTQRKPRRQRKSQRGGLRCQHSLNFHCCYTTMQQKPLPT